METLRVRKLADKSDLDAPHEGTSLYPMRGLDIVDDRGRPTDPPQECRVATAFVDRGRAEGWIAVEGEEVVHRPGGPPDDLWRVTHTFRHYETIVLKTHDDREDVRYKVTHQPDKYVDTTDYAAEGGERVGSRKEDDSESVTDEHYAAGQTRVDHFYDLELES
jgi:hypothetical protein